ncbi:M48 family metallopeptidase [Thalassospira sp.]|uniref:M48 family metallopeptidase n=1 Tax=Thalassospira sp. TaxID=1912094 RepID=UPI0027345CF0|nr:M48 family metallopeptidase [Thalassospira sp.]MDP2699710.1 M48 family metallopeptidase [Thalassospira sp.]
MEELLVPAILLSCLIGIAFITGRIADRLHETALSRDEAALPRQDISTDEDFPGEINMIYSQMVSGCVVIGEDRFRNLLSRLRVFVGGTLVAHDAAIERAQREAMLRMRVQAKSATHIVGVRFVSASLGRGMIEMAAYGTALFTDKKPAGGAPSTLPKRAIEVKRKSLLLELFSASTSFALLCWLVYTASGFMTEWATHQISVEDEIAIWSEVTEGETDWPKRSDAERYPVERYLRDLILSIPKEALGEAAAYDFDVFVIPNDIPNAAALPGGRILVHTGMLDLVETENELLAVLGHEIGHYNGRDHLEGLGRSVVGVALSAMLFQTDAVLTVWIAGWPKILADLHYSRSQELDADIWGLDIAMAKYGHAGGVSGVFEKLGYGAPEEGVLDYLTTHPHPMERVRILDAMIAKRDLPVKDGIPLEQAFADYLANIE